PGGAGDRHHRRGRRRLQLPAGFRSHLPRAGSARRDAGSGRLRADPLAPPRRRDHRHPLRDEGEMTRSSVPPPVTKVMDAASAWLPARMAEVEDRLVEVAAGYGPRLGEEAEATLKAGGKRLRPLLVLMA